MKRMKELIEILNKANRAYYQENTEIISNLEYDALYDELLNLEKQTGIKLAGSPTSKVGYEIVGALKKAEHDVPMLSLDKTKETDALSAFLENHDGLLSWKLDGLTVVLKYDGGQLQQALTRGNGYIGEDITHNARVFRNIPLTVPFMGKLNVRGEAVISIKDFEEINELEDNKYKNPRNLCSGAVRQLNSETAAKRRVLFFAFSVKCEKDFEKKSEQLKWLEELGFEMTEYEIVNAENVTQAVQRFKEKIPNAQIMSDGLVLTYDDIKHSESLGVTSKFPRDSLAFKWADEIAETTLIKIEWGTSRTGLINPVAVFEPVEIEGTQVSRASLHNVSILRGLGLKTGDKICVYKANMIIPQVAENLSFSDNEVEIPENCPVCNGKTEIVGEPETLYCTNTNCDAQKIRALSHFVSRDALNVGGLSEQTLDKLIKAEMIKDYSCLFKLEKFENEIKTMEGFGKRSYDNLISSIEAAKDVELPNFIYALGIQHVGLSNAKLLCKYFNYNAQDIVDACKNDKEKLLEIKGFGEAISQSLHVYFTDTNNYDLFFHVLDMLRIKQPKQEAGGALGGLTFVITGKVEQYKNRKELQTLIENAGGRVTSSVTANTNYLINNDSKSASSKNKKAFELGVPIITEAEFQNLSFD